jgi:ANTAR domain/GAF domain
LTQQHGNERSASARVADIFVELADTLTEDFDSLDLLHNLTEHAVELLSVSAAGVMLADPAGVLTVVASSRESARLLELLELEAQQGPCVECFSRGQPVVNLTLGEADRRWPAFAAAFHDAGFLAVHALPLQLREQTIGAMNLFSASGTPLSEQEIKMGLALASVATIGILQQRRVQERKLVTAQLQTALNSRVSIEQAKGVLAERKGVDLDTAFNELRRYARGHNISLTVAAGAVIDGTWDGVAVK